MPSRFGRASRRRATFDATTTVCSKGIYHCSGNKNCNDNPINTFTHARLAAFGGSSLSLAYTATATLDCCRCFFAESSHQQPARSTSFLLPRDDSYSCFSTHNTTHTGSLELGTPQKQHTARYASDYPPVA